MTPKQIDEALSDVRTHKKAPAEARSAFAKTVKNWKYNKAELTNAWLWFYMGYEASTK